MNTNKKNKNVSKTISNNDYNINCNINKTEITKITKITNNKIYVINKDSFNKDMFNKNMFDFSRIENESNMR